MSQRARYSSFVSHSVGGVSGPHWATITRPREREREEEREVTGRERDKEKEGSLVFRAWYLLELYFLLLWSYLRAGFMRVSGRCSAHPAPPPSPLPSRSRCVHTSRHCVRLTLCTVKTLSTATFVSPAVSRSSRSERRRHHMIKQRKKWKKTQKTSVAFVLFPDGWLLFFVLPCFSLSLDKRTGRNANTFACVAQNSGREKKNENTNSQTKQNQMFPHISFSPFSWNSFFSSSETIAVQGGTENCG